MCIASALDVAYNKIVIHTKRMGLFHCS